MSRLRHQPTVAVNWVQVPAWRGTCGRAVQINREGRSAGADSAATVRYGTDAPALYTACVCVTPLHRVVYLKAYKLLMCSSPPPNGAVSVTSHTWRRPATSCGPSVAYPVPTPAWPMARHRRLSVGQSLPTHSQPKTSCICPFLLIVSGRVSQRVAHCNGPSIAVKA